MARLVQLRDGTWVDAALVAMVRCLPRAWGGSGLLHPPRVVVWAGGRPVVCDFEDEASAEAYRDELAGMVNAATAQRDRQLSQSGGKTVAERSEQ